ncbi:MAG: tRNA uridine-5-carboxymethylaminomethyl(34) synthesis GTPase MnmE [Chitinophagales bacterium]|nr:tRNA uridine-5-carboxymethylaminomethyl(34) synthesis GTPase MnmE [Chitinophagales bacterium]
MIISTIIALASPQGLGAIALIRIDGPDALEMTMKCFQPAKKIAQIKPRFQYFGKFFHHDTLLDEVLITYFKSPNSYSGNDSVEISCHASPFIIKKIIESYLDLGACVASAGEFTQRAFLNGKMDLSQAEAVAELIASESTFAHQIALNQMKGGVSNELGSLRQKLIDFSALIELELDFAEEDVTFADRSEFFEMLLEIKLKIDELQNSFAYGNSIKHGVGVAFVGLPNAGKSSFLNALLQEERAIVSEIPGTTRDYLEESIVIGGITFRMIDTAGLRATEDTIEKIGIERSMQQIQKADIVFYLFDAYTHPWEILLDELKKIPQDKKYMVLLSRYDTYPLDWGSEAFSDFVNLHYYIIGNFFSISSKDINLIDQFKRHLVEMVLEWKPRHTDTIITNLRHYEHLVKASDALQRVREGLDGVSYSGGYI